MLVAVLTSTFHLLIEDRCKEATVVNKAVLMQHSVAVIECNLDFFVTAFTDALERGYRSGDVQARAKSEFSDLYAGLVRVWCANWHAVQAGLTISSFQSAPTGMKKAVVAALGGDPLAKSIVNADNPFVILAKTKYRPSFQAAVESLRESMASDLPSTPEMLQYMITRFEKVLYRGGKMEKNDLLDMLIIVALALPGTRLLTRDRNLKAFLAKHHKASASLVEQLSSVSLRSGPIAQVSGAGNTRG
jgi:hypothetical protein